MFLYPSLAAPSIRIAHANASTIEARTPLLPAGGADGTFSYAPAAVVFPVLRATLRRLLAKSSGRERQGEEIALAP